MKRGTAEKGAVEVGHLVQETGQERFAALRSPGGPEKPSLAAEVGPNTFHGRAPLEQVLRTGLARAAQGADLA
eukprot:3267205-Lingulodinium_polyedra.AAC.1